MEDDGNDGEQMTLKADVWHAEKKNAYLSYVASSLSRFSSTGAKLNIEITTCITSVYKQREQFENCVRDPETESPPDIPIRHYNCCHS